MPHFDLDDVTYLFFFCFCLDSGIERGLISYCTSALSQLGLGLRFMNE